MVRLMGATGAPRWDLDRFYPGLSSPAYKEAFEALRNEISAFRKAVEHTGDWLMEAINRQNRATDLAESLESYVYTTYSTETGNTEALRQLDKLSELMVAFTDAAARFRYRLRREQEEVRPLWDEGGPLEAYSHVLEEQLRLAEFQMDVGEEALAAELDRSGGELWGRLQEAISSELSTLWDASTGERKSVTELRALAFDPDREVRKRAYRLELELWESVETPLAYAINGVKGFASSVNRRRGHESDLERATLQARLTPKALETMISVMRESLPLFRNYLTAKAKLLGVERIAFYDLFAPVGEESGGWTWREATDFIIHHFEGFSEDLGALARRAFSESWIDGEPRKGKVGGAYCTSFPGFGESRILANFDGSFSSVSTLAHELGHAYHFEILKDQPASLRSYPMTLAETASIFCETHIFYSRMAEGSTNQLAILEHLLQETTQVIVDILSRFIFEGSLFEEKQRGFVAPGRLKELMLDAQDATYAEGMDPDQRHPYMWAVKGHYYSTRLGYYNFPYAFGQLFGLGLYAQYLQSPETFPGQYRRLLQLTGRSPATEVAANAGFDLESPDFWRSGIELIRTFARSYEEEVARTLS
ncbi:MAG: M3 family oligoendopeptidase [Alkalispirochaetaceae bacterium]